MAKKRRRSITHKTKYSSGYSNVYRRRSSKTDWAGIGIGDAFKSNLEYYIRLSAQRIFYRTVKKAQMAVAKLTGARTDTQLQPKVKPQLSPCYSTYPAALAAYAAVGLTAFLEFKDRVKHEVLSGRLNDFLENPTKFDDVLVDPESYKEVARIVARWVHTRLLLEDLSRMVSLSTVEIYRLFSASQETLNFGSLSEIIRIVILYGDVLPDWDRIKLHPFAKDIITDLVAASTPFSEMVTTAKDSDFIDIGVRWIRSACKSIAKFLPPPRDSASKKMEEFLEAALSRASTDETMHQRRFGDEQASKKHSEKIAPLKGPNPPLLQEPQNASQQVRRSIRKSVKSDKDHFKENLYSQEPQSSRIEQALANFAKAVEDAGSQHRAFEDIRSDVLESLLRIVPFHGGPIEGNPTDGHEVVVKMAGSKETSGELFDRPVVLSEDLPACDRLLEKSRPLTEALRRSLYPNIEEVTETKRLRTSGTLDPGRLPLADFASTIFRRYRINEKADRRGRPVLVIACDGSGSLDGDQMNMLKNLAAGWLTSTAKSNVQVMAALYHSGIIRKGVSGPLVQWLYHPRKTPATSCMDAVGALVSLPDVGTGVQSDALSLAFIMDEARQLARGNVIYLILVSDTAWNRSFHTEKSGQEEVYSYFQTAYDEFSGRLHTTLVALGVLEATGFEDLLDAVITVSHGELKEPAKVAEKIGVYVANCIRERNQLVASR